MPLVKASYPVDEFIEQLIPHLEAGDIIIDGGNSLFEDTNRRQKYIEEKGRLCKGSPAGQAGFLGEIGFFAPNPPQSPLVRGGDAQPFSITPCVIHAMALPA
jgi:6-phosphogluconate dehydrogenase